VAILRVDPNTRRLIPLEREREEFLHGLSSTEWEKINNPFHPANAAVDAPWYRHAIGENINLTNTVGRIEKKKFLSRGTDLRRYQAEQGVFKIGHKERQDWTWLEAQIDRDVERGSRGKTWFGRGPLSEQTIKRLKKVGVITGASLGALLLYNHFSAKDDNYNTIEGMSELGLAAEQRKILTEFGSGWRGISKIVAMATGGVGIGGLAYLYLKNKFSGKDDSYNTIEGLLHGGEAEKKRKELTEFGSGWIGLDAGTLLRIGLVSADDIAYWSWYLGYGPQIKEAYRSVVGDRISGRDDAYNTIEGMSEKGWAARLRKQGTDFGSGFVGAKALARTIINSREVIAFERVLQGVNVSGEGLHAVVTAGEKLGRDMSVGIRNHFEKLAGLEEGLAKTRNRIAEVERMAERLRAEEQQSLKPQGNRLVSNTSANTVEGLQHGPFQAASRHKHSDIGGWWQGSAVSGKILKYLGSGIKQGAEKLLDPRRAASIARQTGTVEEFAKGIGIKAHIVRTVEGESRYQGIIEGYRAMGKTGETAAKAMESGAATLTIGQEQHIFLHPERLKASFSKEASSLGMSPADIRSAVESEDFLKTVYYHEVLEKQSGSLYSKLNKMPAQHNASQVLIGEGGFLEHNSNEKVKQLFSTIRKARKEEAVALEAGFGAFREEGVSAELRKLTTDFASPYRGIIDSTSRLIAKDASGAGRAKLNLIASARELRIAQAKVWSSATGGGKGHLRISGRRVKQLSRFGGGV
jgi:hypothetical protein